MDFQILLEQTIRMLMRLVWPASDGELTVVPVARDGRRVNPVQAAEELRRYGGDPALRPRTDGPPGDASVPTWDRIVRLVSKGVERSFRWPTALARWRCARRS